MFSKTQSFQYRENGLCRVNLRQEEEDQLKIPRCIFTTRLCALKINIFLPMYFKFTLEIYFNLTFLMDMALYNGKKFPMGKTGILTSTHLYVGLHIIMRVTGIYSAVVENYSCELRLNSH